MPALAPVFVTPELVRVTNGKLHLRYEIGGRYVTDERCNLDDARHLATVDPDLLDKADPAQLCEYDFGTRR